LHLIGDPSALEYAQQGLNLAREKGLVTQLPFLLSTAGEIAMAQGDWQGAEVAFRQGLVQSRRFGLSERIAGLTANLGLLARHQGQHSVAVQRLTTALEEAEKVHNHYLETQIRLWLAPLLPAGEAEQLLAPARRIIQEAGYHLLQQQLDEITLSRSDE
jgi:tetratricopeptide (TPR) repeat protein